MLSGLCALAAIASVPVRVVVPTSTVVDQCVIEERIAAQLHVTKGVRVERRNPKTPPRQGIWHFEVGFRGDGTARISRLSTEGRVSGSELDDVWPASAAPLPDDGLALDVPNQAALEAACRGDTQAAYRHSGAAFGRTLARMLSLPDEAKREELMASWAWASAARRRGDCKAAVPALRRTVGLLARKRLGPAWRRPPPAKRMPSAVVADSSVVIVFEEGDFVGLSRNTGEPVWRNTGGPAEPHPILTGDGGAILVRERAILEVDVRTGRVWWQRAMLDPHSEVVISKDIVFAADRDRLFALSRRDGKPQWTFDGLARTASGPIAIGAYLLLPVEHRLIALHRSSEVVFEVNLADEISAPLVPSGGRSRGYRVWALVGSDELALVDLNQRAVVFRTNQLPGVTWPPAVLGESLSVGLGGDRTSVGFVHPQHGAHLRAAVSAPPTVQALGDLSGVIHSMSRGRLVKRTDTGKILWRTKLPGTVTTFEVADNAVVASANRSVILLDGQSGRIIERVDLDGPVTTVTDQRFGGAALLNDGTVYGFLGEQDPRRRSWLAEARRELAYCLADLNQRTRARQLADVLLSRDPDDLDAHVVKARVVTTPSAQFEAWWALSRRAPPNDPLAQEAQAGLTAAGVLGVVDLGSPAQAVVGTSSDALVLELASGVEARPALQPERILWSRPGGKLGGRAGADVEIDGEWISSWTGEPAGVTREPDTVAAIRDPRLRTYMNLRARTPGRLAVVLSERYLVLLEP